MSVASIVSTVGGYIGQLLFDEVKFLYGVEDKVKSLKNELELMSSRLIDLEPTCYLEDETFCIAVKQMREIAYEAEDVIDSLIVDESTSKLKRYTQHCSCFIQTHKLGKQIDKITAKITDLDKQMKSYNVGKEAVKNKATQLPSYPFPELDEHVEGLDDDVQSLVEKLLGDGEVFLCISGMGGSGKTTLARKLSNHPNTKEHFKYLIWVTVSKEWTPQSLLLQILERIGDKKSQKHSDQNAMIYAVRNILRDNYLIILDDVWSRQTLNEILPAINPAANKKGRIIVTTRDRNIAAFLGPKCFSHEPKRLNEKQSWDLFSKLTFISSRSEYKTRDNEFNSLSEKMLKKCDGLPLAIVALGGLLRTKESIDEWQHIEGDMSHKIMNEAQDTYLYGPVNNMLALSYNDMPYHLKPCFLYLGSFPEDSNISANQLIRLWIAEGIVTNKQRHGGETLEDVARRHLDELVQRCMVQIVQKKFNGRVKTIKIHDLLRDLSIEHAKEQAFLEVSTSPSTSEAELKKSRRASIDNRSRKRGGEDEIYLPWKDSYVRSFRLTGNYYAFTGDDGTKVSWKLGSRIWKRMLLRVLILEDVYVVDGSLPSEIGNLVHLRYLEIVWTNIRQIPESIGNLRNLLTFKFIGFYVGGRPIRLPNSLGKLGNLRHLHLPEYEEWEIYPDRRRGLGLGRLVNNLNTLKVAQRNQAQTNLIQDLLNPGDHSSNTLRKVEIGDLNNQDIEALLFSPKSHSILSKNLVSFALRGELTEPPSTNLRSLDPLINHCVNLQKLTLWWFDMREMKTFPSSLTQLDLGRCLLVETMLKVIGQLPHLKSFSIKEWSSLTNIKEWSCETREFPQLLQLQLRLFDELEGWRVERGALPCLTTLIIEDCPNLKRIVFPDQQFLKRLQVCDIKAHSPPEIVVMETNKYES